MCEKLTKYSCGHYTRRKVPCENIPTKPSFFRKYFCRDKKVCNATLRHFDRRYHGCPACLKGERELNEERQREEARAWWASIDLAAKRAQLAASGAGNQDQMRLRGGDSTTSRRSRARRARQGTASGCWPRIDGDQTGATSQEPSRSGSQAVQSQAGTSSNSRNASGCDLPRPNAGRTFAERVSDPNAYTVEVSPEGTADRKFVTPNGRRLCPPPRPSPPTSPTPKSAPAPVASKAYIVEVSPDGTSRRRPAGRNLRAPPRSAGVDAPSRSFTERVRYSNPTAVPAPLNVPSPAGPSQSHAQRAPLSATHFIERAADPSVHLRSPNVRVMNPEIGSRYLVAQQTAIRSATLGTWGADNTRYPETGESSNSHQNNDQQTESNGSNSTSKSSRHHERKDSRGSGSRRQRGHERGSSRSSSSSGNTVRTVVGTAIRRATAQDSVESFVCASSRELEETPRVARHKGYRRHEQE
ncbi:hypothetical protein LIA77_02766 [Sarocladium implicatum]|nr:hypothetical protein LIA77_02766 [Sarocladium implicatum]